MCVCVLFECIVEIHTNASLSCALVTRVYVLFESECIVEIHTNAHIMTHGPINKYRRAFTYTIGPCTKKMHIHCNMSAIRYHQWKLNPTPLMSSPLPCSLGCTPHKLTLKVLVTAIDAQWEGMGDVGSARYERALLPPCPTIRVLSYSN